MSSKNSTRAFCITCCKAFRIAANDHKMAEIDISVVTADRQFQVNQISEFCFVFNSLKNCVLSTPPLCNWGTILHLFIRGYVTLSLFFYSNAVNVGVILCWSDEGMDWERERKKHKPVCLCSVYVWYGLIYCNKVMKLCFHCVHFLFTAEVEFFTWMYFF